MDPQVLIVLPDVPRAEDEMHVVHRLPPATMVKLDLHVIFRKELRNEGFERNCNASEGTD